MRVEFEQLYRETLKAQRPRLYHGLRREGRLKQHVRDEAERAMDQFLALLATLRRRNPGPGNHPAQVEHITQLARQAREIVVADLLEPIADDPLGEPIP